MPGHKMKKRAKLKRGTGKNGFGMLSVKAGVDNNPKATQADRIAGATKGKGKRVKAMGGGAMKKRVMKRGGGMAAQRQKKMGGGAMKKRVMKRGGGMMKKPMMKRGGKVKK